jgi:hypothetical protein
MWLVAMHRVGGATKASDVSTTAVMRVLGGIGRPFVEAGASLYERYQQGTLLFGDLASRKTNGRALSEETKTKVRSFYMRDGVTRQSPNAKDVLKVRDVNDPKGAKVEATRRWLDTDFQAIFNMFKQEVRLIKFGERNPMYTLYETQVRTSHMRANTQHRTTCTATTHGNASSTHQSVAKAFHNTQ